MTNSSVSVAIDWSTSYTCFNRALPALASSWHLYRHISDNLLCNRTQTCITDLTLLNWCVRIGMSVIWYVWTGSCAPGSGLSISRTWPSAQQTSNVFLFYKQAVILSLTQNQKHTHTHTQDWFCLTGPSFWSYSRSGYSRLNRSKKGKNVDLYSAYRVLHTSNALSSLN